MAALTLKILAGVLQMNAPDATVTSDNQGLKALVADVKKQQLAGEAEMVGANDPDAIEAYVMTAEGGQGGRLILARKNTGFGKATTIFRKGAYNKSVYGPKHKRVFDD